MATRALQGHIFFAPAARQPVRLYLVTFIGDMGLACPMAALAGGSASCVPGCGPLEHLYNVASRTHAGPLKGGVLLLLRAKHSGKKEG